MTQLRRSPLAALFGLLALWIGIELLYASQWLSFLVREQPRAPQTDPGTPLRKMLSERPGAPVARVWFAPYSTFPESGFVESRWRSGVYDTFRSFPSNGLKANYGAFKLSLADILFSQISSQGLKQEAELALELGYQLFAIDTGAVLPPQTIPRLCESTAGCRLSSDGYALFPLARGSTGWIEALSGTQRRLPELLQTNTATRWGSLVFHPDQWWSQARLPKEGESLTVWARPLPVVSVYRHNLTSLPASAANRLRNAEARIELQLAPELGAVDLCVQPASEAKARGTEGCHPIQLSRKTPLVDLKPFLPPGEVIQIALRQAYVDGGLPISRNYLPRLPGEEGGSRRSAFALVIRPGSAGVR